MAANIGRFQVNINTLEELETKSTEPAILLFNESPEGILGLLHGVTFDQQEEKNNNIVKIGHSPKIKNADPFLKFNGINRLDRNRKMLELECWKEFDLEDTSRDQACLIPLKKALQIPTSLTAKLNIRSDQGEKIHLSGPLLSTIRRQLLLMICLAEGCVLDGTAFGAPSELEVEIVRLAPPRAGVYLTSPSTRVILNLSPESVGRVTLDAPARAMLLPSLSSQSGLPKNADSALEEIGLQLDDLLKEVDQAQQPNTPFHKLLELVTLPILNLEGVRSMGPGILPRGLLLSGPPGVGKTYAVRRVCERCASANLPVKLFAMAGAELLGYGIGEGEAQLRKVFEAAEAFALKTLHFMPDGRRAGACAVIFLDEADALFCKRDNNDNAGGSRARMLAQLLMLMDGFSPTAEEGRGEVTGHVLVVGATNRPNELDPALRRPGRFDLEVTVNPPDLQERAQILKAHLDSVPLAPTVDLQEVAALCTGYVGADLAALAREASLAALRQSAHTAQDGLVKGFEHLLLEPDETVQNSREPEQEWVTTQDLLTAMEKTGASTLRGHHVSVPTTKWSDIGGLEDVKLKLQQTIEWPLKHRAAFERFGLLQSRGTLLFGPPGCSKTVLARACASESGATFVSLSGADVYSPFVGDAEASIRRAFQVARSAPPAILFFDEIDGVVGNRQGDNAVSGAEARVLSTFLNEMDGVDANCSDGVVVIGATNRPWHLDAAILRPGRFDNIIYVPLPDQEARLKIFEIHTKKMALGNDVCLRTLAEKTKGLTGSEIEGVCKESAMRALRENIECNSVDLLQFLTAIQSHSLTCTDSLVQKYTMFSQETMQCKSDL